MAFTDTTRALTDRLPGTGILIALLFLAVSGLWWLLSQLFIGITAVVLVLVQGGDLGADPMDLVPTWLMALGYGLTVGGMVLVGVVLAPLTGRSQGQAFALDLPLWWTWPLVALSGLSVGLFPGWIAEQLRLYMPHVDLGALDMISDMLTNGPYWERGLMVIAVCVLAPLFEELVFRGFLWDALDRTLPTWIVWLVTSVIFAAYHLDPVQGTAVLFTGLVLGWIRWRTGSIWTAVLAHMVNNSLATVAAWAFASGDEPPTPLWAALLAVALTAALVGPLLLAQRQSRALGEVQQPDVQTPWIPPQDLSGGA